MRHRSAVLRLGAGLWLAVAVLTAPTAAATTVVSAFGEGPGQTNRPQGLAVDPIAERLYVADGGNSRIDVFDTGTDTFMTAFGWGVLNGGSAPQQCTLSTCRRGVGGSGPGQFASPSPFAPQEPLGIAVDPTDGSVYVSGANRVQKLKPSGEFIFMIGKGVNKSTGGNVCTAASEDFCGPAEKGMGPEEFGTIGPALAVDSSGTLYVGDTDRVQQFNPSGALVEAVDLGEGLSQIRSLTVDTAGRMYVAAIGSGSLIRKYDSAGTLLTTIPTPGGGAPGALALDPAGDLIAAQGLGGIESPSVVAYEAAAAPRSVFGYDLRSAASSSGLALRPDGSGDVYVSEESGGSQGEDSRVLNMSPPPPGPVVPPVRPSNAAGASACNPKAAPIGNAQATLNSCVNPEGVATTFHFEYVDQAGFEAGGLSNSNPAVQSTPESGSIGSDFLLHPASAQIGCAEPQNPPQPICLIPETIYHFRVVAKDAEGRETEGPEATFETLPPLEIDSTWSSGVGFGSATLNAAVNPLGIPASGHFEYVNDAQYAAAEGFSSAQRVPVGEELDFGAGEEATTRSATISGLEPGTLYHYRVVATDSLISPQEVLGPERTFTTFSPIVAGLPDARAYELASRTVDDNSAELGAIFSPSNGAFDDVTLAIRQASPNGGAITYTSFTSFMAPKSAPGTSQYLSRRGAGGWTTANITPGTAITNPLKPPLQGFTPDLSTAAVSVLQAEDSYQSLELQDNATGALRQLTSAPDPDGSAVRQRYCVAYAGASADGQRVIFSANGKLTPDASNADDDKVNLYEWSASEDAVRLVSILPGESPAPASKSSSFGARSSACALGRSNVRHAISADGSRIFWTFVASSGASRLLARLNGGETIQLDAKQGGLGPAGGGYFWAASDDGSKVFFTDPNQLTPGASKSSGAQAWEGDLYRYDLDAHSLTDLTVDPTPGSDPPNVLGVLGVSEDGSYIYFVATGVLSESANGAGETAVPGGRNLYVVHGDEQPRFIATLAEADEKDWIRLPRERTARVTPDGRHLAFLSTATLTGYDNKIEPGAAPGCKLDAESGGDTLLGDPLCAEAYIYDAERDELTCASCNPSGSRPRGPAAFRVWSSPFEQSRYLSNSGDRLFFDSLDALVPQDANDKRDVYEFEREGAGSCTAEGATFNPASKGCLYLISSGVSSDASFFLDATPDGNDAFFSTREPLLDEDRDERYDVYDARVGGGFPTPPSPPAPCLSEEACRGPATGTPPAGTPATAFFNGPGNVKPRKQRRAKRGKHRRRHKKHGKQRHRSRRGKHRGTRRTKKGQPRLARSQKTRHAHTRRGQHER